MYRLTKQQKQEQGILSSKKVENNTRLTIYANGDKVLRLHSTDIITWKGDKIILNNGGWNTHTTRARFNKYLAPYYKVFQKNYNCFVEFKGGFIAEFNNGMDLRNTTFERKVK